MELTLEAKTRTVLGKQNIKLRKAGVLPAVVYGRDKKNVNLEISSKDFERIYKEIGENTLINLKIEGVGEKKVLIHDVAKHYMKDKPIHVDFYEADLTRKIHANIPLNFIGDSLAVKEQGGVLIKSLNEIEVEALPTDLPQSIDIRIESLKTFEDLIRVKDISLGDKVKILNDADDVVVSVQEPRSEEELAELEKPTEEAEKAAIEEATKKEGEEPAEGEEAKPDETGAKAEKGKEEKREKKE